MQLRVQRVFRWMGKERGALKRYAVGKKEEDGAGEEGRTPDLMLGKHGRRKKREPS